MPAAAEDLSALHEPITDFFPRVSAAGDWESYRLSEEQVESYRTSGYLTGVKVLDDSQIERLRGELAGLMDQNHPGQELWYEFHTNESADPNQVLFHALGAWRIAPAFHDILWHPAFVVPAFQLLALTDEPALRPGVRFWHDQLFCKPARHGGVVAWHQDYSYWTRTRPMAHLTCWIGLDDSTRDNGCVQYIPGSHRWNLLPITGLAGDMEAIRQVLDDDQWRRLHQPAFAELKAGECSFHHPLMIHGSRENRTDRPRRATVINAFRDGVASAGDEPPLDGVPPIPVGEEMNGQFFPLLYDGG